MDAHQRRVITNLSSIIFLTTLIIPCILASKQCDFPAVFNFGDSNSDTGGLSAAFGPAPPPHGKTYFHHPTGRYCDGRLIVDFIGIFLFLVMFYLQLHAYDICSKYFTDSSKDGYFSPQDQSLVVLGT